jgi:hypothetical protein
VRHLTREITNGLRIDYFDDVGEPPYMTFEVTYIEAMAWGVMANVEVKTNIPAVTRLPNNVLLMDRFNLMRSADREKMAKRIDALLPPPKSAGRMDWQHHLEHVAVVVNGEMTKPVPLTDLMDRPMPRLQRFLVRSLLAEHKVNVLYGAGGTGKSVLAVRIAASVTTGIDFLGWEVDRPGEVLYLDWEDDPDTMVSRVEHISVGMGLTKRFHMFYKCLRGKGPYERHHADVKNLVRDKSLALVILDSTAMAMHGSTAGDGAEGAIKFYELMAQLDTTVLLIDHLSSDDVKAGASEKGTPAAKPYGSVFKMNSARNVWEAQRTAKDVITLRHRKTNVASLDAPIDVQVTWSGHQVIFDRL